MLDYSELPLAGKLANFLTRLSARDLTAKDAAAMLASIHADLQHPAGHERADYERYAHLIQSFRREMPDVYKQVISNWQGNRPIEAGEETENSGADSEKAASQSRAETGQNTEPAAESESSEESEGGEGGEEEEDEEDDEQEERPGGSKPEDEDTEEEENEEGEEEGEEKGKEPDEDKEEDEEEDEEDEEKEEEKEEQEEKDEEEEGAEAESEEQEDEAEEGEEKSEAEEGGEAEGESTEEEIAEAQEAAEASEHESGAEETPEPSEELPPIEFEEEAGEEGETPEAGQ